MFRLWHVGTDDTIETWIYYPELDYVHGPYSTYEFEASHPHPWHTQVNLNSLQVADAVVSDEQIASFLTYGPTGGDSYFFEAKDEGWGTNEWARGYLRKGATYQGKKRLVWADEVFSVPIWPGWW